MSDTFTVKINCDNAAFENLEEEVIALLETIIRRIRDGFDSGAIMDSNGNRVGEWGFYGEILCQE